MQSDSIEYDYGDWGERLVREGWAGYLLTFMFRPISGTPAQVAEIMEAEVTRIYATLLTRINRHPTRASARGRLPIWFCAPDYPVYKRAKYSLRDVVVNNGRHMHAAAFFPPGSRLRKDLRIHFERHRHLYVRPKYDLDRINAEPITHAVGYVVGYAGKAIINGRVGEDATLILPRSMSELQSSSDRRT